MTFRRPSALLSFLLISLLAGCGQDASDYLKQARELHEKHDFRGSLIALKSAAADQPDNADIRLALARLYLELKQPKEALKEFDFASRHGARPADFDLDIARAHLMNGYYQTVLDSLNLDPQRPVTERARILQLRGGALFGLNKPELA